MIFWGFEFGNWGKGLFYFFGIGGTNPARRSVPKSPSGGMHYCFNATGGCTAKNKPGITPGRSHLLYLHAKYIVNIIINNNVMPLHPFGLCFAMGLLYRAMPRFTARGIARYFLGCYPGNNLQAKHPAGGVFGILCKLALPCFIAGRPAEAVVF